LFDIYSNSFLNRDRQEPKVTSMRQIELETSAVLPLGYKGFSMFPILELQRCGIKP
jgi:hypothetical protein